MKKTTQTKATKAKKSLLKVQDLQPKKDAKGGRKAGKDQLE